MKTLAKKTMKTFAVAAALMTAVTVGTFGATAFAGSHYSGSFAGVNQSNKANTNVYGFNNMTGTQQSNQLLSRFGMGGISQSNKANTNVGGACNTTGTAQGNFLVPSRSRTGSRTSQTNDSYTNVNGVGNVTGTSQSNIAAPSFGL